MDYLTVKQYASIRGVSKQAIYKQLETKLKPFVNVINGVRMLSLDVLTDEERENFTHIEKRLKQPSVNFNYENEVLKEENAKLRAQVQLLQNNNDNLTAQLDETKRKLQDAENNFLELTMKMSEIALKQAETMSKPSFFKRLFLPKSQK